MNNRQKAFVSQYLIHFNATRAAKSVGYSEKTARTIGSKLLTNVDIRAAVDERMANRDEVIAGLTDIARGDMADLMDITTMGFTLQLMVKNKDTGEITVNPKTKLIKKIKQKVTTFISKKEDEEDREIVETEIELYSAHEAYRDLGKVHGIFIDKTDVTSGGEAIKIVVQYADDNPSTTEAS